MHKLTTDSLPVSVDYLPFDSLFFFSRLFTGQMPSAPWGSRVGARAPRQSKTAEWNLLGNGSWNGSKGKLANVNGIKQDEIEAKIPLWSLGLICARRPVILLISTWHPYFIITLAESEQKNTSRQAGWSFPSGEITLWRRQSSWNRPARNWK